MNEEERAEILARAIDALLAGAERGTSGSSHTHDLQSLLNIAQERLLGSLFVAKASLQHEREVWKSVVKRIQSAEIEAVCDDANAEDEELGELAEVISLRRRMAAEVSAIGEAHRDEVWATIQSRLSEPHRSDGVPDFLRRFRRRTDPEESVEPGARPEPSSLPFAHPHPALGPMAESTQDIARARVWARVATSPGLEHTRIDEKSRRRRSALPGLALAAAAAAVIILAVGPLPATGFADHPAARLADAITGHFGARSATPPAIDRLPPPTIVEGTTATAAEASAMAGVAFGQPAAPPAGFELTGSTYLSDAIAGGSAGTFMLVYSSRDANLAIYQQTAGGMDFAANEGSITRVALSDGTPATLVRGSWLSSEGLSWSSTGSQSLIFERAGALVVIELSAVTPQTKVLFQVADSIQ